MQLTKYERRLRKCLNEDVPKPKYKLWQTVEYNTESEPAQATGQIRGLCFNSVEMSLHEYVEFGWVYVVCDGGKRYSHVPEYLITKAID
jgi:hypothetical protein